jgi:hypothetical protein
LKKTRENFIERQIELGQKLLEKEDRPEIIKMLKFKIAMYANEFFTGNKTFNEYQIKQFNKNN